jgi:hypothetical protein
MIDDFFELLEALYKKEEQIHNVLINLLGGKPDSDFLGNEKEMIKKSIVKAFGGNEKHYEHVAIGDAFDWYENHGRTEQDKKDLIENIVYVIENSPRKGNIAYMIDKNSAE